MKFLLLKLRETQYCHTYNINPKLERHILFSDNDKIVNNESSLNIIISLIEGNKNVSYKKYHHGPVVNIKSLIRDVI